MASTFHLIAPRFVPPLEPEFRPAVLANRAFRQEVAASGQGVPLVIGLERSDGALSRFETVAFPDGHPRAGANLAYAERLVKFLLWARGGWKVYVGGPASRSASTSPRSYAPDGARSVRLPLHGRAGLRAPVHRRALRAGRRAAGARGGTGRWAATSTAAASASTSGRRT